MDQAEYDVHAAVEDRHWWWRARRDVIGEVIARFAPSSERLRIVEVGCASGGNLPMLARFGDVLGTERDDGAIAHFHRKRGDRFRVVRHAIPEPLPGRFDILAMLDVLEHLPDDVGAVRWAAEHLRPGGILIVTAPASGFLWTEQDEAVHHLRRYTRATLARLMPRSLELLHLTCFNTLLFLPIAAARAAMNLTSRGGRPPRSHLGVPREPINALLYRLFRLERHWVPRSRMPLGVSVLAVARRMPGSE